MGQSLSYGLNQVEVEELVELCNGNCRSERFIFIFFAIFKV